MKGYWWAEYDPEAFGGPEAPWVASLETEEGIIVTIGGIAFYTQKQCEEWIEQYVLGRDLRRD